LKNFKQGLIDPDKKIKHDRDRDHNFSSKVRQNFFDQEILKNTAPKRQLKLPCRFSLFQQGLPETSKLYHQGICENLPPPLTSTSIVDNDDPGYLQTPQNKSPRKTPRLPIGARFEKPLF
jgi:hypothetical protein